MLGDITAADEIYIVTGRTDMRKCPVRIKSGQNIGKICKNQFLFIQGGQPDPSLILPLLHQIFTDLLFHRL